MKEVEDFKMLRKGNKVRKYLNSANNEFNDYIVEIGGFADRDSLIYCRNIKNKRPEWISIHDLFKLIEDTMKR